MDGRVDFVSLVAAEPSVKEDLTASPESSPQSTPMFRHLTEATAAPTLQPAPSTTTGAVSAGSGNASDVASIQRQMSASSAQSLPLTAAPSSSPPLTPPPAPRQPGAANATDMKAASSSPSLTADCAALYNVLLTASVALALVFLVHLLLICLWTHVVNCRYYRARQRGQKDDADSRQPGGLSGGLPGGLPGGQPRPLKRSLGAKRVNKPTTTQRFFPYPKSLVWPTPLLFVCCVFLTPLAKASVTVLATRYDERKLKHPSPHPHPLT